MNNKKVRRLQDVRRFIAESATTGYVTVSTQVRAFIVFSLKKILDDELRIANDFLYPVSKMVQKLYRVVEKTQ
jgi:hypothetical protein